MNIDITKMQPPLELLKDPNNWYLNVAGNIWSPNLTHIEVEKHLASIAPHITYGSKEFHICVYELLSAMSNPRLLTRNGITGIFGEQAEEIQHLFYDAKKVANKRAKTSVDILQRRINKIDKQIEETQTRLIRMNQKRNKLLKLIQ